MASKVIDPVCGLAVDVATSKYQAAHSGNTYHFCSAVCRAKFIAEPVHYLHGFWHLAIAHDLSCGRGPFIGECDCKCTAAEQS